MPGWIALNTLVVCVSCMASSDTTASRSRDGESVNMFGASFIDEIDNGVLFLHRWNATG